MRAALGFAGFLILVVAPLCAMGGTPDPLSQLGPDLAQVRKFAAGDGDKLWTGYGEVPFDFLLISGARETLLCRRQIPDGFSADGHDMASDCDRWTRPRSNLPDNLLAAMPVFGPPAAIVMGTPQTTGKTRAEWLCTILHEHFHQWQMALPDYFRRVDALNLKNGDESGMWMLNYPFPYDEGKPAHAYARAAHALLVAVEARGTRALRGAFADFLSARKDFAETVAPDAWRYLEFETWQEGGARWTEIELGKVYPRVDVREAAAALERQSLEQLRHADLKEQRRGLVYAFGSAQLMLVAACDKDWRARYARTLSLTPLLETALASCRASPRGNVKPAPLSVPPDRR